MKKLYYFLSLILLCTQGASAQDLIGRITDMDSARTPLFMAEIEQMQEGQVLASYKTYFDGTFRLKVKPDQTYQLKISFAGRSDTTLTISVDKHGTLYSGTLFISLHKDGLRLTGFILDQAQDIPIKDACIILRNVMTRKEDRYVTDVNGSYNLKMDYETNYTLKLDKMSPGILNKYADTSFNISTIGFNSPLDFRLDIKLGPNNGYTAPRPEYNPHAKPVNRALTPALVVLGVKDSVKKHEQDSVVALLSKKLNSKDSVIASLDKRINDINKNKADTKVVLRGSDEDEAVKMKQEVEKRKQQLADEIKQKELEKSEADLKVKQRSEKELQDKLDKEIRDTEARKKQQQAVAAANEQKERMAVRAQAEQDSLLKVAITKNKLIMAHRKHVADSVKAIENQKTATTIDPLKTNITTLRKDTAPSLSAQATIVKKETAIIPKSSPAQDSLKTPETKNREMMLNRKRVLDSLINIESQKVQRKTDTKGADKAARIKDSIKVQQAILAEKQKRLMAQRVQAEQDSLLMVAESRNREMMARRKYVSDSIALVESQRLQAISNDKKLEREKQEFDLAEKKAKEKLEQEILEKQQAELAEKKVKEKLEQEILEKQQAELAEKEKQARELALQNKAKEDQNRAAEKADQEAASRKTQLEKDLAAMKKARQVAEARVLAKKREKEAAEKAANIESKRLAKELIEQNKKQKLARDQARKLIEDQQRIAARKAEIDAEQRELEAKRSLEEQEKSKLTQQLGNLQKDEQSTVTKDHDAKQQDYNPDLSLKNEKSAAVNNYEVSVLKENKRKADSIVTGFAPTAKSSNGATLIKAKGYVKNGQTEDPIPNVSINIRRLNSIISQEVTSDVQGRYDIIVDSGYFYLVSFYKDKYEISKQILDLTAYKKADYTMVIQYLKERDDFDPTAKMPIIQFDKNSSKLPADLWGDMQTIVKMMKDIPDLKVKIYGLGSVEEDYPMELSVTRARLVADLLLESGIKPSRIRINGIGAYRPRSGCTEGKQCSEDQYKLDRVVMYKVVKE